MHYLTTLLLKNAEKGYADFSKKLIPDTNFEILGVRVPTIKKIARSVKNDKAIIFSFFNEKHTFYEEKLLHGLLIQYAFSDLESLLFYIEKFLPEIDNWAICDSTVPSLKILGKHQDTVLSNVLSWINSSSPYTVRFGVVTLMDYFLTDEYIDFVLTTVSSIKSDHYYVNMAIAWLLSVALVKYYDKTFPLIKNKTLPKFIHNKTIQKAIESFRVSADKKAQLKEVRI